MRVEYSSNNSGGAWWMNDDDWKALEDRGWTVEWYRDEKGLFRTGERFLGALASRASKEGFETLKEGVEEWEEITGMSSTEAGCPCCGQPHNFYLYDGDKMIDSGPHADYSCSW